MPKKEDVRDRANGRDVTLLINGVLVGVGGVFVVTASVVVTVVAAVTAVALALVVMMSR